MVVSDPVAGESDAVATFTLTLDRAPTEAVSVEVATAPSSASWPEDFTALQTQVHFDPGQLQATVSVPLSPDALDEDDRDLHAGTLRRPGPGDRRSERDRHDHRRRRLARGHDR